MKSGRKALLLIGSPRKKSNSESIGDYLLEKLSEQGFETNKIQLPSAFKTDPSQMLSLVSEADLIIFSCPLYVDGPPSFALKAMEKIAEVRKNNDLDDNHPKKQRLMAISNSGFPEAYQNDCALSVYRYFAEETGFHWSGGMAMGMGEAIGRIPLKTAGGKVHKVMKSLEMTAVALAAGGDVPDEAIKLMAKPIFPKWLYVFIGNYTWKREAKKRGTLNKLDDRPFA